MNGLRGKIISLFRKLLVIRGTFAQILILLRIQTQDGVGGRVAIVAHDDGATTRPGAAISC